MKTTVNELIIPYPTIHIDGVDYSREVKSIILNETTDQCEMGSLYAVSTFKRLCVTLNAKSEDTLPIPYDEMSLTILANGALIDLNCITLDIQCAIQEPERANPIIHHSFNSKGDTIVHCTPQWTKESLLSTIELLATCMPVGYDEFVKSVINKVEGE